MNAFQNKLRTLAHKNSLIPTAAITLLLCVMTNSKAAVATDTNKPVTEENELNTATDPLDFGLITDDAQETLSISIDNENLLPSFNNATDIQLNNEEETEEVWNTLYAETVDVTDNSQDLASSGNNNGIVFKNARVQLPEDRDDENSSLILSKPVVFGIIVGAGFAMLGIRRVLQI